MIHQEVAQPVYSQDQEQAATIKLIGVGGGGCNAVEHMIGADIHGVDFTLVNTDAQALARYNPNNVIQLGSTLTRGLGAGTDPEIGRLAAEEDADLIAATIGDTDMLFLTAGMGGGTGTGAIPVIARIARELGVLTVAVVTKPFAFEGGKRRQVAEIGLKELRRHVDSLIVVPNENLLTHLGPNISLIEAFAASNDVLTNAVQSIAELITDPGLINVDFADVKSVMTETGEAMMSTGRGIGEYRARDAAIAATESPLLEDIDLNEARGILANITASDTLSMGEFQIVGDILDQITAQDANVVIGTVFDADMNDEIRVTVVATGLQSNLRQPAPQSSRKPASTGFLGFGKRNSKSSKRKAPANVSRQRHASPMEEHHAPVEPYADRIDEQYKHAPNEPVYHLHQNPVNPDYPGEAPSQSRPVYEQPVSAPEPAPEPVPVQQPQAQFCQACGNHPDNHTSNCPLNEPLNQTESRPKRGSTLFMDERRNIEERLATPQDSPARQPSVTQQQRQPAHQASSRKHSARRAEAVNGKKPSINKHLVGLVAGTVVLLSVFYLLVAKKTTIPNSAAAVPAVTDSDSRTDVASRKLRDAQKRLSGL